MILGSHNSISYKRPKYLIMGLLRKFAKCQDKTLSSQIRLGVKCFDFRIRFTDEGYPFMCHGIIEYPGSIELILQELNSLEGIYVRLCLENIYNDSNAYNHFINAYTYFCKKTYPNIKFMFCVKKPKWTIIENNFDKPFIEAQKSPHTLWEILKTPKGLLKYQKEKLETLKNSDAIVLQDFV